MLAAPPDVCDVLIAGGGPVGAALALALRGAGLEVCLVDPPGKAGERAFRPVALSHGSRLALERAGAFDRIAATPIDTIHVSQSGGFGRTVIRREEHDLPALGYVSDLSAIEAVLLDAVAAERTPGRVAGWQAEADRIRVRVANDAGARQVRSRLLVLADGGQIAGDDLALRDYGQTAIVARVRTEIVRPRTAWERFTPEGPLALLPFANEAYAAVWTVRSREAPALAEATDERFAAALGERFGRRLGRFAADGPRASYPLRLWFRRSSVAGPRVLAIGNAAQTLHPVAGQGLNLGLRDAAALAAMVRRTPRAGLGGEAFVAAFRDARRLDRFAAIGVTDLLVRVFSNDSAPLRLARGLGLAALDLAPPARRLLARGMMLGIRGLP
jgi:2-octaprenyl-6-methoxyphenol hydroxylase